MTYTLPVGDYYVPPSALHLVPNTEVFTSPTSQATQRIERGGAIWVAEFKTRSLKPDEVAIFEALFAQLKGSLKDIYVYDPRYGGVKFGVGTGTPLVNGANQTGNSLVIDGATFSVANWLLAGTHFEVNGEYKILTENATTNGSGQTTLYFEPPLRESPPDNTPITLTAPKCRMILASNEEARKEPEFLGYASFSFKLREVFDTTTYWLDESGNYLTDQSGNRIIT